MVASRGLGAAMLPDLALERGCFRPRLLDHVGKSPRQHAGLAACIDGYAGWPPAADRLDCRGQAPDRARQ